MRCAYKSNPIAPEECPEIILSLTDAGNIARCRACPHGQQLMATVRINPEEAYYTPELKEDPVPVSPMTPTDGVVVLQEVSPKESRSKIMSQTYTIPELAALIGVDAKAVTNAKYSTAVTSTPGSKMHRVREYMTAHGITWEQVVAGRRGKRVRTTQTLSLGQAIARELSPGELEEEAEKRLSGRGPIPGSSGAAMSLEDVLGELRRCLPGATLTIPL